MLYKQQTENRDFQTLCSRYHVDSSTGRTGKSAKRNNNRVIFRKGTKQADMHT